MVNVLKKCITPMMITFMCFKSIAAVVSDNDGSAFITKAEFDSLKNTFQSQIDQYNASIDSKIDTAIAAYLSGIKVSTKTNLRSIINEINGYGYNYNSMAGYPFTNGNINLSCTTQTPEVNVVGFFGYQNLNCNNNGAHHAGARRQALKAKTGAGTAWEFTTFNDYRCLTKYMNVYEILNFTISDAPALHQANNWGLAHTYASDIQNKVTNLNEENVSRQQSGFLRRTSKSADNYTSTGLASGGAYLTLTKSIYNTDNSAKKGYMAPINAISTSTYGYGYNSGTILGTILTSTNPISGATETDNYKVTFPTMSYYAHSNYDKVSNVCMFDANTDPAVKFAYEHLYWNKHYVNTSRFALTDLYTYPATMAYGTGVKYYHGLPVCTNISKSGTLTFKMKAVTTSSGGTVVNLCFRSGYFLNNNPTSDSNNNLKKVKYKTASATTWTNCTSQGVCENLTPGTEYQFMIEDFPENKTLWVKPSRVQRNSESTQVYAYLTTVDDIVIESEN